MIKLKEGQKVIAENGDIYIIEKDDVLTESHNMRSLVKEMENITLRLYKNDAFDKSPEWKVRKLKNTLVIDIEPNDYHGNDIDRKELQLFVDVVVETTGFGGYQNGYGGWMLTSDYKDRDLNEGDYNNMMTTDEGKELTYDEFISMCKPLINQMLLRDDLPENIDVEKEVIDFCKVNYARYFKLPEFDLIKEYVYNQNLSKNWE